MGIVLSTEGTTHSVRHEEEAAFADWINTNLGHDKDLEHLLPVDAKNLYQKITDGILLSWVVYVFCCPGFVLEVFWRIEDLKNI